MFGSSSLQLFRNGFEAPRAIRGHRRPLAGRRRSARPAIESLDARTLLSAGALDTTFGGTGKVISAVGTSNSWATAVAVQPDSKVIAVGHATDTVRRATVNDIALARYNADGTLDGSFGSGGVAMLQASEWAFPPDAVMALQADGKIVVAIAAYLPQPKHSSGTNIGWEILRFNANGSLDTTFGGSGTGKVTTDFTATADADIPYAITIQPTNGDIVVAGEAGNQGTIQHFAVARYTAAGILDSSFGTGGEVVTPIDPSTPDEAQAVAIDSSGRILVGGQSWTLPPGSNTMSALVRYNPNGTLDTSFGHGGIQTELLPGYLSARTIGLGFQSTGSNAGKIIIALEATEPSDLGASSNELGLARLQPDGSLDHGFGSSGFYVESRMSAGGGGLGPASPVLAIQPDDKLLLTGQGMSASANGSIPQAADYYDYIVTRVLADGSSYDPAFGSAGLGQANLGAYSVTPNALALGPDGKVIVAGQFMSDGSHSDFATARFLGDPTTTTLTSSLDPSTYGQSSTFTATVIASDGSPTGTVRLYDGPTLLAARAIDSSGMGAPDSTLGPLVLDETLFPDTLKIARRRQST